LRRDRRLFGFGNWLPSLLEARGVEITKSLLYSGIIAFSYPIAPLFFSLIADRMERKWRIVAGAALTAGAGLLFAQQTAVAGWIVFGLLVTIGNNVLTTSNAASAG
jgi:putative MFS transporter